MLIIIIIQLKRILKKFRNKFIHRKDIGLEYFKGDPYNNKN